ncbi:UNVERIFIED_CONTAM: hypothetical protein Sradi_1443600 [Sesamum radiatum]|uniref:Uncharacterized protein n=1 Tax=Sesamum radiatum TaxID=300843 RepID=A0AAW2U5I2_SESRA
MAPPPGPYSGKSTLALVARVSAFTFGLAYGSVKLKILKHDLLHVDVHVFDIAYTSILDFKLGGMNTWSQVHCPFWIGSSVALVVQNSRFLSIVFYDSFFF